jgi:hypothetical protein
MTHNSVEYLSILNSLSREKEEGKLISKFIDFLNQQHTGIQFRYAVEKISTWNISLATEQFHCGYINFNKEISGEEYQLLEQASHLLVHFLKNIKMNNKNAL